VASPSCWSVIVTKCTSSDSYRTRPCIQPNRSSTFVPCALTCTSLSSRLLASCIPDPLPELVTSLKVQQQPLPSWEGASSRLLSISAAYLFAWSSEQKCFPNRMKSRPFVTWTPQTSQYFVNNPIVMITCTAFGLVLGCGHFTLPIAEISERKRVVLFKQEIQRLFTSGLGSTSVTWFGYCATGRDRHFAHEGASERQPTIAQGFG